MAIYYNNEKINVDLPISGIKDINIELTKVIYLEDEVLQKMHDYLIQTGYWCIEEDGYINFWKWHPSSEEEVADITIDFVTGTLDLSNLPLSRGVFYAVMVWLFRNEELCS